MASLVNLFVEWDDRYRVGVPAIDRQHRYLIAIIRELQEAMAAGTTTEVLATLIRRLVTYTHYHFAYEEGLYGEKEYSGIREHRKLHKHMAEQVSRLEQSVKAGKLRVGAPVVAFLQRWLTEHILGEDLEAFHEVLLKESDPPMEEMPKS